MNPDDIARAYDLRIASDLPKLAARFKHALGRTGSIATAMAAVNELLLAPMSEDRFVRLIYDASLL